MDQSIPRGGLGRRTGLASALLLASGAIVLGTCRRQETGKTAKLAEAPLETPAPPTPEQLAIESLTERAGELAAMGSAQDPEEFDALFTAARAVRLDSPRTAAAFRDLIVMLGFCTSWRRWSNPVEGAANELVSWHERLYADYPQVVDAEACRFCAEASLMASDLRGLDRAIRRGLQTLGDDPTFLTDNQHHERAQLAALAVRLNCILGRLEIADDYAQMTIGSAEIYQQAVAQIPADHPARESAEQTARSGMISAHLACADLNLMAGSYQRALDHMEAVSGAATYRQFCRHLVAALSGDGDAESELEADCSNVQLPVDLVNFGMRKLIQLALDRDDVSAAQQRLGMWRQRGSLDIGVHQGLDAMLEIEIALRAPEQRSPELLTSARTAFGQLLQQWRKAPDLAGGIGFLHMTERSTLAANLLRLECAMDPGKGGASAALAHVLDAHAATSPGQAPTIDAVRNQLLGEHHAALVYVPGRFGSVLLTLSRKDVKAYELASDELLRKTVSSLKAAAETVRIGSPGARESLDAAVRAATQALLPAEARALLRDHGRVTVVGASMLDNAPFELLRVDPDEGATDHPYLGQNVAIIYVPNLAIAMTQPPTRLSGTTVIAGSLRSTDFDFPPELVAACGQPYELHGIRPKVLTDAEVSKSSVRSLLSGARIVNLIGHGKSDWHRLYENGMLFGNRPEDGLWGEDVLDLDLNGATVILSACEAGNAPWRRGGDPLAASLAGAMMSAGARCVLVPTSNVQLGQHMRAMASIHQRLANGQPLAEALRTARQDDSLTQPALVEMLLLQVHGLGF